VVVFVSIRYDEEVRALFARLERFRADRRGIESTFGPPREQTPSTGGQGAAPDLEKMQTDLEKAASEAEVTDAIDLQTEDDLEVVHREMCMALIRGKGERAREARGRFHELSEDEVESAKTDALFDALTFDESGNPEDFKKLRDRVADSRITGYVERLTGMVLENVKRPAEAAEAYARAAQAGIKSEFRAEMVAKRGQMLIEMRKADTAEQEIKVALRAESDPGARAKLWKALADTYAAQNRHLDQAIALQEARQHEPNDSDLCFQIAWALGNSDRNDVRPLAIHFYRVAIYLDSKNEYAQNNLGWEYSKAGLPIHAAAQYGRAVELNNTLGMANLAGIQAKAGLVSEAEAVLKKAQKQDDPHENVTSTLADIGRARAEQAEKVKELAKGGADLAEFCSKVARAELQDVPDGLPTQWRWGAGIVTTMDISGEKLTFEWKENKKKLKLEADLRGRSGRGNQYAMSTRFSYAAGEEVESGWEKDKAVLFVVEEDGKISVALLGEDGPEFRLLSPQGESADEVLSA